MFGCCFRLSILSLSPLKCCPECNNCKYHMLRYRIEKSCSVAYGISVFEVKKNLRIKSLLQCNLKTARHTLEKEDSITDGGKVEGKGSNASIQSFIHFYFFSPPFQLPATPKQTCGRCSSAESYGSLLYLAILCDKSIQFGHTKDNT